MEALDKNEACSLVKFPDGRKLVGVKIQSKRDKVDNCKTLALPGLLFHFVSLQRLTIFSLPPSANLQAR